MRLPPLMICALPLLSFQARAQGTDVPADEQLPPLPAAETPPTLPPPQTLPRTEAHPPPMPAYPLPPSPTDVRGRMPRPAPEPGAYLHDGLYLRLGIGAGLAIETIEWTPDGGSASSVESTGLAFPIDIALGGTLGRGFVLGGALHNMLLGREDPNLPLPESERGGQHTLSALGLYADWYLDPEAGFHIQGMIAGGSLLLSNTASTDYTPTGVSSTGAVGYEWWIGPDSSVGILARVDWASLAYEDDDANIDFEHRLLQVGLMATATHH